MSEDKQNQERDNNTVDLSELSKLEFATAWTPSSTTEKFFAPRKDFKRGNERRPFNSDKKRDNFREERPNKRKSFNGNQKDDSQRKGSKKFKGGKSNGKKFDRQKAPFNPTMEVLFYPDDTPFNKLIDIMKASKRTYQLFDIAQLMLEKPERFVILAKNLPDSEGNVKPLYCAQPLNLPFEDEAAAKNAAIQFFFEEMFTIEQIEAEAPKGNFQVVNKSTVTGELIGAPNWHRYNEYLREYHRQKAPKMPFDAFASAVESVRDPEQIAAWLETMKTRDVYKLKNAPEGANDTFDTYEAAINYIAREKSSELVKTYEQVRMKGVNLAKLPFGRIKRNIEEVCRRQRHFPIVTANNLRGRLRRSGFTVYKRGSKGFAFVSVVKRKFLFEGDALSETPQAIFNFITENAGIATSDLPYKFIGIEAPESKADTKVLVEENATEANQEIPQVTAELSDEVKAKLSNVLSEMLWLISEGYVVEYADGTLQANPYLPRPKDKNQAPSEAEIGAIDEPIVAQKEEKEVAVEENPEVAVEENPEVAEESTATAETEQAEAPSVEESEQAKETKE